MFIVYMNMMNLSIGGIGVISRTDKTITKQGVPMKKLIVSLQLAMWIFASVTATAEIHEIKSMKEITSYITPQTLLVFDLDNTVVEPVQTLGSDQWFEYMVQGFEKSGLTKDVAVQKSIIFWNEIAHHTKIRPVEAITPFIIRQAQAAGIPVLGLTARHATSAGETERQLASIGVNFKLRPVYSLPLPGSNLESAFYRNGIMYVGPTLTKGAALAQLFNQLRLRPGRVVFVDDKVKHTQTVDASLTALGIENHEFRYGAADARVSSFNSKIADFQLVTFLNYGVIVSDEKYGTISK